MNKINNIHHQDFGSCICLSSLDGSVVSMPQCERFIHSPLSIPAQYIRNMKTGSAIAGIQIHYSGGFKQSASPASYRLVALNEPPTLKLLYKSGWLSALVQLKVGYNKQIQATSDPLTTWSCKADASAEGALIVKTPVVCILPATRSGVQGTIDCCRLCLFTGFNYPNDRCSGGCLTIQLGYRLYYSSGCCAPSCIRGLALAAKIAVLR